jgi:hypothetical protein
MSEIVPIREGVNGRDANGRFAVGWIGGPGAPKGVWRRRMADVLKQSDVEGAAAILVECMNDKGARWADRLTAAIEVLNRAFGRATVTEAESAVDLLLEKAKQKGIIQ